MTGRRSALSCLPALGIHLTRSVGSLVHKRS